VFHDVMGMYEDFLPKHSRRYANIAQVIRDVSRQYMEDVKSGRFPGPENSFDMEALLPSLDGKSEQSR